MKSLLQKLGKLLVDLKFAKNVGTKSVWKQLRGGKKNTSVELVEPDPFCKKKDRKTVALAKIFSTI